MYKNTLNNDNDTDIVIEKDLTFDELVGEILQKSLVVHNDNVNTFDWVILSLMEICDHTMEQAEQCALIVHTKGKCSVKGGTEDTLRPLRRGLVDRGINATIE
jgi:ATP-dependent Clp protease adaptor protein ClpS